MRPPTSNSVYGTFEQAYSYIRNQDILSDLEGLFGGAAPYDGVAYIIAKNNGTNPSLEISINGTQVLRSYAFNSFGMEVVFPFTVPFKKGDVLGITGGELQSGSVRYYKLRDYTGR